MSATPCSLGCVSDDVGSLEHPSCLRKTVLPARFNSKPSPSGLDWRMESVLLWALFSRKGNSFCVDDSSVAPRCAQAALLPHCRDREGPRARWPLGGSCRHL